MSACVSVIIPCYNQAAYLRSAVDSVIAQSCPDWECIIVNDGSSDNTRGVALELAATDSRIRYVEQSNRGLSGARNRGLDEACGRYVQFLDADDLIDPRKLETQLGMLENIESLAVALCDYRITRSDGVDCLDRMPPDLDVERPLQDIALRWELSLSIPVHVALTDARVFYNEGIRFDESLPNHEDWDVWMRVIALNVRVFHTREALVTYRRYGDSMCSNGVLMRRGFIQAIYKQLRLLGHDREMRDILEHKLCITSDEYCDSAPCITKLWCRRRSGRVARALRRIVPAPLRTVFRHVVYR